jgi:hypothetical protein
MFRTRAPRTRSGFGDAARSEGGVVVDEEVRPLGGRAGCLVMILVWIVASIALTVLLNLLVRG